MLAQALGAELADRIVGAVMMAKLEPLTRPKRDGTLRRPVEWGDVHGEAARHLRHVAHFVLLVLELVRVDTGRAASSRLWLGRTRDEKTGKYVPSPLQLGLAGRVGVCVRQLERYTALLEAAGVWKVWQPMEADEGGKGPRAPKKLPRKLRGETYAYNHWQLIGPVPRRLRQNLERFYGKKKSPPGLHTEPGAAATNAAAPASGPSYADEGADILAALKAGKLSGGTRAAPS